MGHPDSVTTPHPDHHQAGATALETLYHSDFDAWSRHTAKLLRERRFAELDLEHLIDEVGDTGKSQRQELVNRLRVLLAHLLKWQFQYAQLSQRWAEFEGRSWRSTIIEQRAALRYLLLKNPGLKGTWEQALEEGYRQAVELFVDETGMPGQSVPAVCPYGRDQILDRTWYPPQEGA